MTDWIINLINNLESYLIYVNDTQLVVALKWLAGFLSIVFGILVVLLIVKLQVIDKWLKVTGNFLLTTAFPKKHLNKSWQKILLRLSKNDEASLRLALLEADNLFDELLKQMQLPGESMADRLKYIDSSQISNIDEIWQAHKLREQIDLNPDYPIVRNEIEFGVQAYEKALKELEFID